MPDVKLISAGTVLDGDDLQLKKDWAVLVEDDQIRESGPRADLAAKHKNVAVQSYDSGFMTPGMIDCHVHLLLNCYVPDYLGKLAMSEGEMAYAIAENIKMDLASGVTTCRTMGDRFHLDILTRRLLEEGRLKGPHLRVCGFGLRSSAGHGYNGIPCDGELEIIKTVRRNIAEGADWIKFYITGMWPRRGVVQCFYTRREIDIMIDLAHRAGIQVTSHNIGGQAMDDCIDAGIDCLEHVYFADDAQIDKMLKRGTWACLTASEYFTEKEHMAAWYRDSLVPNRPAVTKCLTNLVKAGVPFALGTDGMHGDFYMEMKYAVDFGAKEIDALRAGTINAARLNRVDDRVGSIKAGKQADLCIVNGDPLKNICDMKNVAAVYQDGVLYKGNF